jgi:hypothetical protein
MVVEIKPINNAHEKIKDEEEIRLNVNSSLLYL